MKKIMTHPPTKAADGSPLFYVRCVKDKQKRETSWQIITEKME